MSPFAKWTVDHYKDVKQMNDEYLAFFLSKFGSPTEVVIATSEQIESYRGILPDRLLEYWQQ
ncbi:GAD-like domain-containing protein, partial [Vibrio neptunius]|uniref:GAD-like domain-containing protein n=1 Tax=Vibrio neptunius TaxID=170651 RepID=UPI0030B83959